MVGVCSRAHTGRFEGAERWTECGAGDLNINDMSTDDDQDSGEQETGENEVQGQVEDIQVAAVHLGGGKAHLVLYRGGIGWVDYDGGRQRPALKIAEKVIKDPRVRLARQLITSEQGQPFELTGFA